MSKSIFMSGFVDNGTKQYMKEKRYKQASTD